MVRSSSAGLTPRPTPSAPWGSKSTSSTRQPNSASAAPRLIAVVVFPTPPFWLHSAITRAGRGSTGGRGWASSLGNGRPVGPRTTGRFVDIAVKRSTDLATGRLAESSLMRRIDNLSAGAGVRQARPAGPRVSGGVHLAEMVDRDQRVDLRGGHRRVPQQLLHRANVSATVEQMG